MAERPSGALDMVAERIDQLNAEVNKLRDEQASEAAPTGPFAELSTALGAIRVTTNAQTANIRALLDIVIILAQEIDALRDQAASPRTPA